MSAISSPQLRLPVKLLVVMYLMKANHIEYTSQIKPAIYLYIAILSVNSEFEHLNQRKIEPLLQNSTYILVRLLLIIIQSPLIQCSILKATIEPLLLIIETLH